ncbi:MAG: DUF3471 domain-containing protein [Acidobacteria bacterium]|nr:DUF3471 domain-containing protein [Acidobacteriota bacterium]
MRTLLILSVVFCLTVECAAQQPSSQAGANVAAQSKSKPNAEALRKYAGRYELEVGIIPVSTLDVTFEGGELWVKPTNIRKRRLVHKSKATFTDEIEGTPVVFKRDDEGKIASLTFRFEGESYTAQRVELPAPSLKGNTTFRLKGYSEARVVALAGTFNNWHQSQLLFAREGEEWVCRVDLNPGVHAYKFVVDGNWLLDPANPNTAEDDAGNLNNVVEVAEKP